MAAIPCRIAAISSAEYRQLHEHLTIPVGIGVGIRINLCVHHVRSVVLCLRVVNPNRAPRRPEFLIQGLEC